VPYRAVPGTCRAFVPILRGRIRPLKQGRTRLHTSFNRYQVPEYTVKRRLARFS